MRPLDILLPLLLGSGGTVGVLTALNTPKTTRPALTVREDAAPAVPDQTNTPTKTEQKKIQIIAVTPPSAPERNNDAWQSWRTAGRDEYEREAERLRKKYADYGELELELERLREDLLWPERRERAERDLKELARKAPKGTPIALEAALEAARRDHLRGDASAIARVRSVEAGAARDANGCLYEVERLMLELSICLDVADDPCAERIIKNLNDKYYDEYNGAAGRPVSEALPALLAEYKD
jgi:hypothetical protein